MTNRLSLKSLNRLSLYMCTARDPMHGPWRAIFFVPQGCDIRRTNIGNGPFFPSPVPPRQSRGRQLSGRRGQGAAETSP